MLTWSYHNAQISAADLGMRPVQPFLLLSCVRLWATSDGGRAVAPETWLVMSVPAGGAAEQTERGEAAKPKAGHE